MATYSGPQLALPPPHESYAAYRLNSLSYAPSALSPGSEPFDPVRGGPRFDQFDDEHMTQLPNTGAAFGNLAPGAPSVNQMLGRGSVQLHSGYTRPRAPQNATITTTYPDSMNRIGSVPNLMSPVGGPSEAFPGRQGPKDILSPQARAFELSGTGGAGALQQKLLLQQQSSNQQQQLEAQRALQMQNVQALQLERHRQQQQMVQQQAPAQGNQGGFGANGLSNANGQPINLGNISSMNGVVVPGVGAVKAASLPSSTPAFQQQSQRVQRGQDTSGNAPYANQQSLGNAPGSLHVPPGFTNSTTPQSSGAATGNTSGGGLSSAAAAPPLAAEEISTIFVVGFPDDMQEREFQNMFTFSPGFEAATLKIPNKDLTSYGPGALAPGSSAAAAVNVLRQAGFASSYAGGGAQAAGDPYSLVGLNAQGGLIDSREISSGLAAAAASGWQIPEDPFARNSASGLMGIGGNPTDLTSHLALPMPRKQIIGFAKFRTREQASEARDVLQGRRIDVEKGAVLKAEMAKKNLHTKRGVGPLGGSSAAGNAGANDPMSLASPPGMNGPNGAVGLPGYAGVQGSGLPPLGNTMSNDGSIPLTQRDKDMQTIVAMGLNPSSQRIMDTDRVKDRQQRLEMEGAYQQGLQGPTRSRMTAYDAFHSVADPEVQQHVPGRQPSIVGRGSISAGSGPGLVSRGMLSPTFESMSPSATDPYAPFGLLNGAGDHGLPGGISTRAGLPSSMLDRRMSHSHGQVQPSRQDPMAATQDMWESLPNTNASDPYNQGMLKGLSHMNIAEDPEEDAGAAPRSAAVPSSTSSNRSQPSPPADKDAVGHRSNGSPPGMIQGNRIDARPPGRESSPPRGMMSGQSMSSEGSPSREESRLGNIDSLIRRDSGDSDLTRSSMTGIHTNTHGEMTSPPLSSPGSGGSYIRTNSSDQNPPINTLYVGNLPTTPPASLSSNPLEENLKTVFSQCPGFRKLCFRQKSNGPMCFIEFDDVDYATKAMHSLYGHTLNGLVKGGIRLSFSKNPLGVRSGSVSAGSSSAHGHIGQESVGRYGRHGSLAELRGPSRQSSLDMLSPTGSSFSFGSSPPSRFFSPPPPGQMGSVSPPIGSGRNLPGGYFRSSQAFADTTFSPFAVPVASGNLLGPSFSEEGFEEFSYALAPSPDPEANR
ncbi:hypothetical protein DACRYDRAFT_92417 [Dacryopinax primogenitus]|uniref:RRM domain-containing protein n=1 Tax=Dacryopinax primogenitus (strain DJM 731) TaxID=1858805 RepID=M5GFK4_DACPD|nr:uncharacterized protein DACRYDRAFT_92417 [Dacryopinax primogenitus]EJU06397.1 hypothetical protein DACRYDRAFT_92417 [Dacryopinax primogenitus]